MKPAETPKYLFGKTEDLERESQEVPNMKVVRNDPIKLMDRKLSPFEEVHGVKRRKYP